MRDIAARIGVNEQTIRNWIKKGHGPPHLKGPTGKYFFPDINAVNEWLKKMLVDTKN